MKKKRERILYINSCYSTRSTGKIVKQLETTAILEGCEVYIAYSSRFLISESAKNVNHYIIGNKFDVYSHVFQTRILDKHALYSKKATYRLVTWIKKIKPDVIHLHNLHGYYLNIEILFKFLKNEYKGKIFWTLHDCWAFTGHCSYYTFVNCNKWQIGCDKCPQKNKYPKSYYDNSSNNFHKKKNLFTSVPNLRIITPSKWLADEVAKSFLSEYECTVLNNEIDHNIFNGQKGNFRDKYNLNSKYIVLGVANIWDERKGINDFIKLSKMTQNNKNIVYVLIGAKDSKIKKIIKSLNNVIDIDRTDSQKELAYAYAESNLFFCPTYEDTSSLVCLEARASNIPVICYKSGGAPETIEDYDKGFVYEVGCVDFIYEKFLRKLV